MGNVVIFLHTIYRETTCHRGGFWNKEKARFLKLYTLFFSISECLSLGYVSSFISSTRSKAQLRTR